ncbi:hypothetical protein RJT34_19803 [Clitoria ternatea]|uniref:Uncharacterized protein n=1 Tax=Clitoria ternatea TaxID=43366 RepID=A0AAN9IS06_CLITE
MRYSLEKDEKQRKWETRKMLGLGKSREEGVGIGASSYMIIVTWSKNLVREKLQFWINFSRVIVDGQMILLLGDLKKEAFKKTNAIPLASSVVLVSMKEHISCMAFWCISC